MIKDLEKELRDREGVTGGEDKETEKEKEKKKEKGEKEGGKHLSNGFFTRKHFHRNLHGCLISIYVKTRHKNLEIQ